MKLPQLSREIRELMELPSPPGPAFLQEITDKTLEILENEQDQRPADSNGLPGGLLELHRDRATIVVPDLHARREFLLHVLMFRDAEGVSIAEKMAMGRLQLVCVGDGFHAESRAAQRWKGAFSEYTTRFKQHKLMDEEMTESLGLMMMVMRIKQIFPDAFHFLKGNHENIRNENGHGNRPFGKFAYEGEMVKTYMEEFYPEETISAYYRFEHNLPILAVGDRFCISHAEPAAFHPREEVINYRTNPEAVYDFIWTDDNAAEEGSVEKTLSHYLGARYDESARLLGGHRPVKGVYNLRAEGRYVQIHNPSKYIIAVVRTGRPLDPEKNIIEIRPQTGEMLKRLKDLGD